MTSPTDGHTEVRNDLLLEILSIFRPVHAVAELTDEVLTNVQAGQPHSAAVVAPAESGLVLVDGKGQNARPQVQLVGIAVAVAPLKDMTERYSELCQDEDFLRHLAEAGLIETPKRDDGEEE